MNKRRLIATFLLAAFLGYGFYTYTKERENKNECKAQLAEQESLYKFEEGKVHGTTYHITYESPTGKSFQDEYEAEFKVFDLSVSAFNDSSIISRINKNDDSVKVDHYFRTVFETGQKVSEASEGAFDMTVAPLVNAWGFGFKHNEEVSESHIKELMKNIGYKKVRIVGDHVVKSSPDVMLDASAIAKGYSCDVVAELLEKNGIKNYMVEIGGECVVKGKNRRGEPWLIGITKPEDDSTQKQNSLQTKIQIGNGALATSGNYRRFYYKGGKKYAHTIDPKTGYPVSHNLLSATIYGPTCIEADAYATACMVLGVEKAMKLIESKPELEGYFIYSDNDNKFATISTKGFDQLIAPNQTK